MDPTIPPTPDRILGAAADIVIGDGVEALGYGTIAERIGCTRDEVIAAYPVFESLLAALLTRQYSELLRIIADNVERDPKGGLPSRIFGYAIAAVYEHQLARALYLADPIGLNRIMRSIDGVQSVPDLTLHPQLLPDLQLAGTMRSDVDPNAIAAVLSVVGSGIAMSAPIGHIDAVIGGVMMMLERSVDADVTDTSSGKQAFFATIASFDLGDASL